MRQQLCEFSEKRFDCIPQTHSMSYSKEQLHRDTCKKTQTPAAAAAADNIARKWRLFSMNYSRGSYNIKSKLQFNTLCLCIITDLFCFLLFPTNTSVRLFVCYSLVYFSIHIIFPRAPPSLALFRAGGVKPQEIVISGFIFCFRHSASA